MARTSRILADRSGFTLIELLVVISILSLLVVTFLPPVFESGLNAKITDTKARCLLLGTGIGAFKEQRGWLPPDDFNDLDLKLKLKADNGINTGIESLVVFLSQDGSLLDLSDQARWLANTDQDDNGAIVPRLGGSERREVVDAWGTPLAYFSSSSAGSFERQQKIRLPGEEGGDVLVTAWKGAEGTARKYQLVSAGQDRTFNTADDIVWPERN